MPGNPLFNAMSKMMPGNAGGGMNPMGMFGQIQQMMKSGNPQQAAMQMLQQKNPQAFQQVQSLMQSGQNPEAIFNQMVGQMNPQQAAQIKQMMGMFGGAKK